ncbi:MAG: hypothetical protein ACLUI3_05705 [Christensenellales bacterium]
MTRFAGCKGRMSKMKVQDATKELSRRAAKLLGDVTGVRTAAEKTLAELRKIENGFTQQQEAEREESAARNSRRRSARRARHGRCPMTCRWKGRGESAG